MSLLRSCNYSVYAKFVSVKFLTKLFFQMAEAESQCRQVILPMNISDHSEHSLKFYLEHLSLPFDFVHIVSVIEIQKFIDPTLHVDAVKYSNDISPLLKEAKYSASIFCQSIIDRLKGAGILSSRFHLKISSLSAGEMIVNMIKEKGGNFVVLGSRCSHTTNLSTTCSYVLHHIDVPVCIVPYQCLQIQNEF